MTAPASPRQPGQPADPAPAKGCTPALPVYFDASLMQVRDADGRFLADIDSPNRPIGSQGILPREDMEADAAHIVLCVNAHDALRDACAAALMYAEYYEGENGEEGRMLRDKLRSALRRAQPGEGARP